MANQVEQMAEMLAKLTSAIEERDRRIAELEGVIAAAVLDLSIRGEQDEDGVNVVNISWSIWERLKEALGGKDDS